MILCFFYANCSTDYGINPSSIDTVYIEKIDTPSIKDYFIGKTTWIEVEYNLPEDTTWWTFCDDGTMYAAWKQKKYNGYIQYEKGTWGLSRSNLMTLTPRTVIPKNGNDLVNCIWVETTLFFCYIQWESGITNKLEGFQAYENGKIMNVRDGDPNVIFRKWKGKHLDDITNPIFY